MGDMKEFWEEVNIEGKINRAMNTISSTELLKKEGFDFEVKNLGAHIIIGNYDFWPSTGRYINRKTKKRNFGVKNLIKELKGSKNG